MARMMARPTLTLVADDAPEPVSAHSAHSLRRDGWGAVFVGLLLLALAVVCTEQWYLAVPVDAVLLYNMHIVLGRVG